MDSPVLGDPLYNRFGEARKEDRAYLHAYGIRFQIAGKKFEIIDPPLLGKEFESGPFKDTLKRFSNPFFLGKAPKPLFEAKRNQVARAVAHGFFDARFVGPFKDGDDRQLGVVAVFLLDDLANRIGVAGHCIDCTFHGGCRDCYP
jgi:hypothetical protein